MTLEKYPGIKDEGIRQICIYLEELLKDVQADGSLEATRKIMGKINSYVSYEKHRGIVYGYAIIVSLANNRPDISANLGVIAASRNYSSLSSYSSYIGCALMFLAKPEAADAYFKYGIKKLPSNPETYSGRASLLFTQGKFREAMDLSQIAVKLEPHNYGYWMALGLSAEQAHADDVAINAYNQAIKLKPKNFEPYWQLYDIYEKQKRHQDTDSIIKTAYQNVDHRIIEDFIKEILEDAERTVQ